MITPVGLLRVYKEVIVISLIDLEDLQSSYCHLNLLSAGHLLPGSSLLLYRTLEGEKQGVSPASALLPSIQPLLTTPSSLFGHLRALEKQKVDLSHTYAEDTCAREAVICNLTTVVL